MPKEITNHILINTYKALTALESKVFDGEVSYAIYEMISHFRQNVEIIEKFKNSLVVKYADKDDKGQSVNNIKPTDKNWLLFITEFEAIMNKTITLDFEVFAFKKEHYNLSQNKDIPPFVFSALEWTNAKEDKKEEVKEQPKPPANIEVKENKELKKNKS